MTSYRFCRPDDMHVLVKAVNTCILPASDASFSADDYKALAQDENLWSSSCMIALERDASDVVAVILGCKRESETLLMALGVRPDQSPEEHLPDMLESLRKKFVILGPPTMVVEVGEEDTELRSLLLQAGFRRTVKYSDWVWFPKSSSEDSSRSVSPQLVEDVTLQEVCSEGLLENTSERAWRRQLRTLENLGGSLRGHAIVSSTALESFSLFRTATELTEILAVGYRDNAQHLGALLGSFCSDKPVSVPRVGEDEVSSDLLASLGFQRTGRYERLVKEVNVDYQASSASESAAVCSSNQAR